MATSQVPIYVLHVDDDPVVLEFVETFIKPLYPMMDFTAAENPLKALQLLESRSFDCVISDYKMPEMNGLELAKKIRELSDVPIILYTGQGSEEVAESAFEVGVDDYIKKEIHPAHYQILAKSIASIVNKRRVESRNRALEKSEREKLEALYRHATGLVNLVTVDKVAECSLDIIEKVMGFTVGVFFLVSEGNLVPISHRGGPALGGVIPLNGRGITVKASKEKKSILVRDVRDDPNYLRGKIESMSELAVPIILGGETIAVINFESLELGAFDETDQKLLEILSEHVASTIQRIRLNESVERYATNLETLQRHAADLAKIDTLEGVASYSFKIIEKLLGFKEGAFGIVKDGHISFICSRDDGKRRVPDLPLDGRGITVRAVKTGESQLVQDVRLDDDYFMDNTDVPLFSEMDIPVKVGGVVVAVINLEKEGINAFTNEDRRICEVLSEHLASAIIRINQLKTIKESVETYQKLLDSSLESVLLLSGTVIIYANPIIAKLLCYDNVAELIGKDISHFLTDDENELLKQRTLARQRGEPQPDRYELNVVRKDGQTIDAELVVNLTEYRGKPAVLVIARDISDRKRHQTKLVQLHESAERLAGASTREEIWDTSIETLSMILGFDFAGIGLIEGNNVKYIRCRGSEISPSWCLTSLSRVSHQGQ